jgi:O-antigen ligase/tetratricopeptide (TPR) repeat protein
MSLAAKNTWGAGFCALLYLLVHFIPDFGGADVMGSQWLYVSLVDFAILLYILLNQQQYKAAIDAVLKLKFTIVYSFLVIWAIVSITYSINAIESLVCLARLLSTYLIFINLSILFFKKEQTTLFNVVSILVGVVLLFDSLYVITGFSKNMIEMNLDQNIISLTGKNGNKNVMAASLLIKFPFLLFVIVHNKLIGKIAGFIVLFLGMMALFILNTRSTFVGLGVLFIMFSLAITLLNNKQGFKLIAINLAYFILPLVFAFFTANGMLTKAVDLQGFQGGYGSVTKRVGDINVASEQNSRIKLWKAAIDYTTKHPFLGAGYGNWKLASIPYEKEYTNDLFVPYHCHNDYIEMFADLGIIGGLSFAALFVLLGITTVQFWLKSKDDQHKFIISVALMAIACYFVDAFFNFPAERTSMQTMFALSAALLFLPIYLTGTNTSSQNKDFKFSILLLIPLLLIVGVIYVNYQTFTSLKVQKYVMGEINEDPKMALEDVKDAFPEIPNLSTSTLPIKALVARYYLRDKMNEEAMRLLNESDHVNPYLHYNDFIKTAIFSTQGKFDSTFYYAKKAFYNWPRATSYYKNMIFASAKMKDTAEATKAFKTYIKYRNSGEGWNQYILGLIEINQTPIAETRALLDTAIAKFPADSAIFVNTKSLLYGTAISTGSLPNYAALGAQAFQKGKYTVAANYYLQASAAEPGNYTHFENMGICYYTAKSYEKAIQYFNRAIDLPSANTGKSEFFKAMSYIAIGNNTAGCSALQAAKAKKYQGVDAQIAQYCK